MVLAGSSVAVVLHSFTVSNQYVWTFPSNSLQPSVKYVYCFRKDWNKLSGFLSGKSLSNWSTRSRKLKANV